MIPNTLVRDQEVLTLGNWFDRSVAQHDTVRYIDDETRQHNALKSALIAAACLS